MPKINFKEEDIKEIIRLYLEERQSLAKIGQKFSVSPNPIKRILKENDITLRTNGESLRDDLTGKKFGKLTVLYLDPNYVPKAGRHARWLCKCDCGNEISVESNHLKDGSQSSCSPMCKKRIEVGTRFGRLTVIEPTNQRDKNSGAVLYKCQCDCGNFQLISSTELRANRKGSCDICAESIGVANIRKTLETNNIPYIKEKTFSDCKNLETNSCYRFDFYVDNKYLIEFDGEQHFEAIDFWGGKEYLETCQARDHIKNEYCKKHNIPLIRIPYTIKNQIKLEDLLLETSKYIV